MQSTYILEPITVGTSEIQVPAVGRASVGREATNEYSFPHDLQMSSVHFEIGAESGGCRIWDLGSSNGLFLNTKRVSTAIVVEGDEVQAGGARWHLVVRHSEMASCTPESAGSMSPIQLLPEATPPAWPSDDQPQSQAFGSELILTSSDGSSRRLAGSQRMTIGRTTAAQWVFEDDEQMSSCHMELSQQLGVWKVMDKTSSNGTFVNGSRVSEVPLFSGDEIRGGQTVFNVSILTGRPEQPTPLPAHRHVAANRVPPEAKLDKVIARPAHTLAGDHAARRTDVPSNDQTAHATLRRQSDGQEFDLALNQLVSLGRSAESLISLASDFEVSTQHATLLFDGTCLQLRDVGSSNGTFVGGERIIATELVHGDQLRVGKTEFVVCLPQTGGREPSPAIQPSQEKPSAALESDFPYYSNDSVDGEVEECAASVPSSDEGLAALDSEHPMWSEAPPPVFTGDVLPESQAPVNEHPAPPEPSSIVSASSRNDLHDKSRTHDAERRATLVSASSRIDLHDKSSYAEQAAALNAIACRSGLFAYLGEAASLQPIDVCLSLLRATSGWVLNGSEIENWIEAASQGLSGQPREWLNPSHADDASWMLPFLGNWGSGSSWLVFSHVALEDGLHCLRNLRQPSEGRLPLLESLNPTTLAEFLTEQSSSLVEPFFAPFDAILLEVGAGERWAIVGRHELEAILKNSDL